MTTYVICWLNLDRNLKVLKTHFHHLRSIIVIKYRIRNMPLMCLIILIRVFRGRQRRRNRNQAPEPILTDLRVIHGVDGVDVSCDVQGIPVLECTVSFLNISVLEDVFGAKLRVVVRFGRADAMLESGAVTTRRFECVVAFHGQARWRLLRWRFFDGAAHLLEYHLILNLFICQQILAVIQNPVYQHSQMHRANMVTRSMV